MMIRTMFDFDRVRVFTHARTETPYGFSVGHLDDWLVGVVSAHLGFAFCRLKTVEPQEVKIRWGEIPSYVLHIVTDFIYPEDSNVIVFDHHSPGDSDRRCSVHRLLDELVRQGLYHEVPPIMHQVSLWDVVGPQSIDVAERPDPDRYLAILGAEPEGDSAGYVFWSTQDVDCILRALHRARTLREFVDLVFDSSAPVGERARLNHSVIMRCKEEMLESLLAQAETHVSPSGVKYAVLHRQPAGLTSEVFARLGVDVLIHPNERTEGAVSVVLDSNGRFASTPVAELIESLDASKVVFCHPGGWLVVVYPPVVVK